MARDYDRHWSGLKVKDDEIRKQSDLLAKLTLVAAVSALVLMVARL